VGEIVSHKYDGALLSYGAGVNSTAMAIMLINEGWRGPILFADTGCEWPETYCFMECFEEEWLRPRGMSIVQIGNDWRPPNMRKSLVPYCQDHRCFPLAAMRWCTSGYKARPIARWAKEHRIVRQLIGIAADESHRQRGAIYPLVDMGIDRKGCIRIIESEDLPVPRKSGCYICPFQGKTQWHELWKQHPELFAAAEALEANAQRKSDNPNRFRLTIDPSGRWTLAELRASFERQLPLFDDTEMDDLLAYKPCVCGL